MFQLQLPSLRRQATESIVSVKAFSRPSYILSDAEERIDVLFVTGDTHGDFERFRPENWLQGDALTKDDYVIVLGDFGLNLEERTESFEYWRDWLASRPWTTLWVDGNHENFGWLETIKPEEWHGGKVQRCSEDGSVLHLMRGQVFDIDSRKIFSMGGARCGACATCSCIASLKRSYGGIEAYWADKAAPSQEDYEEACRNLERVGWKVDYVVTHSVSTEIQDLILPVWMEKCEEKDRELVIGVTKRNQTSELHQLLSRRIDFNHWYAGHYHGDREIDDHFTLLRYKILQVWPEETMT
jgi:hypothetical protein